MVLKAEMGTAATANLPTGGEPRDQVQHMWTQWLRWATTNPEKRRALAHLEVAAEITAESHRTVSEAQKVMADVLERSRGEGPIKDAPLGFVLTLADAMIREPAEAEAYSRFAFGAIWRVLAGTSPESN